MAVTLLTALLFCCVSAYAGQVPPPKNVRIVSQNMGLILEWDAPKQSTSRHFRYTAQYKSWQNFDIVCRNISALSCDFTNNVSIFGTYLFAVQTELDGECSDWVYTDEIILENNTTISAPGVRLQARTKGIEVDITEPVLRKSNLKETYTYIDYNIFYWTEGEEKKHKMAQQSRVMLINLTPEVQYCVQVQLLLDNRVRSLQSQETCAKSPANDDLKPGLVVLYLIGSILVTFIAVLLVFGVVWTIYRGIRVVHPRAKLPEHFKQYLLERPNAFMVLSMQNTTQQRELYHDICIIATQDVPAASQENKALINTEGDKDAVSHIRQHMTPDSLLCENTLSGGDALDMEKHLLLQ